MTEQNKADLIARMRVMLGKEMSLPAARYLLDSVESKVLRYTKRRELVGAVPSGFVGNSKSHDRRGRIRSIAGDGKVRF